MYAHTDKEYQIMCGGGRLVVIETPPVHLWQASDHQTPGVQVDLDGRSLSEEWGPGQVMIIPNNSKSWTKAHFRIFVITSRMKGDFV